MMNPGSAGHAPARRAMSGRDFGAALPSPAHPMQDVVLRHLRTRDEIDSIVFLRDEIDLSVHTAAGATFAALEKKETSAASSAASSAPASGSAPSASCPSGTN